MSAAAQDTTAYSAKIKALALENKKLKRDGVKLFILIERMQQELAIAKQTADSTDAVVLEYKVMIARLQKLQQKYELLSKTKSDIIDIKDERIGRLEHEAKLLKRKAIIAGLIPATVGVGAAAVLVTFLILKK